MMLVNDHDDHVCSQGGSTIRSGLHYFTSQRIFNWCNLSNSSKTCFFRGVQKLEQGGVRAAFMGAVQV